MGYRRLQAHRPASVGTPTTTGEGYFNTLISPERIDTAIGEEL